SRVAAGSIAALVASGVYAAWRDLGAWGALTGTRQGKLLIVKLSVLAALLLAAALSRRWLRSRTRATAPMRWSEQRRLRQSIGGETALAAAVLAGTALLVAA